LFIRITNPYPRRDPPRELPPLDPLLLDEELDLDAPLDLLLDLELLLLVELDRDLDELLDGRVLELLPEGRVLELDDPDLETFPEDLFLVVLGRVAAGLPPLEVPVLGRVAAGLLPLEALVLGLVPVTLFPLA